MPTKKISSRDNPQFKELRQLASSTQTRHMLQQTLLDGIHLSEAYIRQIGMPRLCIVSETALAHPEVNTILLSCEAGNAECIVLPDALFHAIRQVEQGVQLMLLIDIPTAAPAVPLQESAVLLDNVQDPGNLGSILRTTAAAGISVVFCSAGCASAWAPKVLRAGMGAHFSLAISENIDLAALMSTSTVPVVATSLCSKTTIYSLNLCKSTAWLFGHEGHGVRPELLALTKHQVLIPQNPVVESLNIAASVAICLFEQVRQKSFV